MQSRATVWEASGCPFRIEFATPKLDEIRLAAVEGFYAVPRGGIEIGGVLFGTRDGQNIRIESYRMVACEHKTGPSFHLSENDLPGLEAAIAMGPGEPMGWFHSHTRSEIFLSAQDLEIYNRYFPQPWQVALVLRPDNMQPVRAGYFFRDTEGNIAAERSCHEFVVDQSFEADPKKLRAAAASAPAGNGLAMRTSTAGLAKPAPAQPPTEIKAARPPKPASDAKPLHESKPASELKPVEAKPAKHGGPVLVAAEPTPPAGKKTRDSTLIWAMGFVALLVLAVSAYFTREAWMPARTAPLKLHASADKGNLVVRWNPVNDRGGELRIRDGASESVIPLDPQQVSRGSYVHPRKSEKTTVRMKVGPVEELTVFAGPLPPHEPSPEEIERAKERERDQAELKKQTLRVEQLQLKLKQMKNQFAEQSR